MASGYTARTFEDRASGIKKHGEAPTRDDVSITIDGIRLDTKEKVLAFLAEVDEIRKAEQKRAKRKSRCHASVLAPTLDTRT